MSVAEHEEEEPSDDLLWCEKHELSYWKGKGCSGCKDDEHERKYKLSFPFYGPVQIL